MEGNGRILFLLILHREVFRLLVNGNKIGLLLEDRFHNVVGVLLSVQASTGGAVEAIHRITNRMLEIDRYASAVAAAITQQNAATSEISHNVASAARGTQDFVSVLDQVASAATQTRHSAHIVLGASEAVGQAVSNLRSEVESFLRKVAV